MAECLPEKGPDGCVFLDRDPDVFSNILSWLRTGDINCENAKLVSMRKEADFFEVFFHT